MDIMKKLYNICDPLKQPPEGTYVDLCSARGDSPHKPVVSILQNRIDRAEKHTHLLFSGHPGSGKSTELLRLCKRLDTASDSSSRFFPIYIDADKYINRQDVDLTEILLAIVGSLAETLRDEKDIHLESSYLESRWNELKDLAFTDVELEKAEFSLTKYVKFVTKLKQADSKSRLLVREKLSPKLPSILDEINLVLDKARVELKKINYQDLVLVVDNLEKIQDVVDPETKLRTYDRVFITGGEQLSSISAHAIFTVPLPLIHSPQQSSLIQTFGEKPHVLPMVKVEEKNGTPCESGLNLMREVLRKRFNAVEVEDSKVFDSLDTFTYLCLMSGGHVRNLLMYFRSASDHVDSIPFSIDAVKRGIQEHINAYSYSIPENNWKFLAELHLNSDKQIPNDDDHQQMLGDLSILEYRNGGQPWYAVNPVVRELNKFKKAVKELEKKQENQTDGTDTN